MERWVKPEEFVELRRGGRARSVSRASCADRWCVRPTGPAGSTSRRSRPALPLDVCSSLQGSWRRLAAAQALLRPAVEVQAAADDSRTDQQVEHELEQGSRAAKRPVIRRGSGRCHPVPPTRMSSQHNHAPGRTTSPRRTSRLGGRVTPQATRLSAWPRRSSRAGGLFGRIKQLGMVFSFTAKRDKLFIPLVALAVTIAARAVPRSWPSCGA